MDEFEPTRAARLIEQRRKQRGMSIREAAKAADLSEGRWRQIAKGYQQLAQGARAPVTTPPATTARMAMAVGVTSDELVAVGERQVADIVRESTASRLRHPSRMGAGQPPSALGLVRTDDLLAELTRRLIAGEAAQTQIAQQRVMELKKESTDAQPDPASSTRAGGSPAPDVSVGDYTLAALDDENLEAEIEGHEEQP
ncbi:MAG: helix-turn-helix transcriptional regulator [Micrococcales bacterium]|nr:helix-turn-helix transcriptional regulator [Micrococcales bacterium]